MKATIDKAGRVVIPARIRSRAGLQAGMDLDIRYEDGEIRIVRAVGRPHLVRVKGRFPGPSRRGTAAWSSMPYPRGSRRRTAFGGRTPACSSSMRSSGDSRRRDFLHDAATLPVRGGRVHDFHIGKVALEADARIFVTGNGKPFEFLTRRGVEVIGARALLDRL